MKTGSITVNTPVAFALALLLFTSAESWAQACDIDGVPVEFSRLNGGALILQDVKTKEIAGKNRPDQSVGLSATPELTTNRVNGVLHVQGLDESDYPDGGFAAVGFDRKLANIWEANFPRGLYEFRRKSDLRVELIISVPGGEAVHVTEGGASTVTLDVSEGMIHEVWWGGSTSLRALRGNLEFSFSDMQKLARAGVHRANVNVCVNIRGHL